VALCLVALAATLLLRPQGRMVEDEPVPAGVGG